MTLQNDNATVLVSYTTPVAAFVQGRGFLRCAERYSVTTSRQINKWLLGINEVAVVPQAEIAALLNGGAA